MKPLLPLRLLGLPVANARAAEPDGQLPSAPHGKSLKLIWQDEFDGDTLDESKWTYRPDGKRKGGWWSRKAISLDGDGDLFISTFMDGNKPFAFGRALGLGTEPIDDGTQLYIDGVAVFNRVLSKDELKELAFRVKDV